MILTISKLYFCRDMPRHVSTLRTICGNMNWGPAVYKISADDRDSSEMKTINCKQYS
jgi:hypothetical protein